MFSIRTSSGILLSAGGVGQVKEIELESVGGGVFGRDINVELDRVGGGVFGQCK